MQQHILDHGSLRVHGLRLPVIHVMFYGNLRHTHTSHFSQNKDQTLAPKVTPSKKAPGAEMLK